MGAPEDRGPLFPRGVDEAILAPVEAAGEILNMEETPEGTLRSVEGPAPWLPARSVDQGSPASPEVPAYFGPVRGIFHARIREGARDVLLLMDKDSVRVWGGWQQKWDDGGITGTDGVLLGPSAKAPVRPASLEAMETVEAPPQWVSVPNGVIIIPPRGRAYFFDGNRVGPLGYDVRPPSPIGKGPSYSVLSVHYGYNHTAQDSDLPRPELGIGRKGTIEPFPGTSGFINTSAGAVNVESPGTAGRLLPGSFSAAVQWLDAWGNLSPLSTTSAPITLPSEDSGVIDGATGLRTGAYFDSDHLGRYFAWTGIVPGPDYTVGRIVYTSRDQKQSGTIDLFEHPSSVVGGLYGYATLQDNVTTFLPDNVPEAWLSATPINPMPVPEFRTAALAFGRLFIIDVHGKVRWSQQGLWGTFLPLDFIDPDPTNSPVALHAVGSGVLVMTRASTFLITETSTGFEHALLSQSWGCVAPDSVATMSNGSTVWFGGRSFYSYDGAAVQDVGASIEYRLRKANRTRWVNATATVDPRTGQYLCAITEDSGQFPTAVFALSTAERWSYFRVGTVRQFAAIEDPRQSVVFAGKAKGAFRRGSLTTSESSYEGVWLWGHRTFGFDPAVRRSVVETPWLGVDGGHVRKNALEVYIWLRETDVGNFNIEVFRDYRKTAVESGTVEAKTVDEGEDTGVPAIWGTTILEKSGSSWVRRRPFWRRISISVFANEVIKIRLSRAGTTLPWEMIAISYRQGIAGASTRVP
jgi:hypothetical protein